jgi:hypothetical protein
MSIDQSMILLILKDLLGRIGRLKHISIKDKLS